MKVITFVLCLFCISATNAENPSLPGKKEQKQIKRIFGEELDFMKVETSKVSDTLQPFLKNRDAVFVISKDEQVLGYLLTTQAKGRFDLFDYSVIYSDILEVISMKILVYRSSHGAGVCSKGWLKQFKGYSGGTLELGKDIDAISGATFSASSLVKDADRCYHLMAGLIRTKVIL